MAHSHRFGFPTLAIVALASAALASIVTAVDRMTEAIAAFVSAALMPQPDHMMIDRAEATAQTLGLVETRAFAQRRINRPDSRSRAPASMAFVTA